MKNLLPLVPKQIIKEIEYQSDSIISKVLLQSEKLNLTLFAMAAGQEFSPHTTTREVIVHILEGKGDFMLGDVWHKFGPGDYFYMPEKLLHAIKAKSNFKFLLYLY
ncbi:MAG TPA: cupin domain-containing protein [Candidatus Magasanikbacteria bacterium]|uniref:Cupin 2 conserved barrel domain protein n=2 Tax=Candidatus Magasanikiibacteriota TaxID=1752731 RepID=A0A0G0WLT8_9BACT|nr:MAG: Cupin 2 conserved barrel domain protein [Candidatus Magasanikbacteria bacterium GW2011_GWC2_41_17]KKS13062.1 MAG: Cupin 2 conserved barrel domain protein [Candidatus Magasanikbacteria bacterium GW2011_GWA2_41_55]HBV57745.1 cupin domain-containing protein [Candidatus Magasanikbacteria bacterium]